MAAKTAQSAFAQAWAWRNDRRNDMCADRRSSGLRFLENLAYLVPGYEGYRSRERRQEEDARLRSRVNRKLMHLLSALESIHDRWSADPWDTHMDEIDQRRVQLQTIVDTVKSPPHGYAVFFSAELLEEELLERLLESDLLVLQDLEDTEEYLEAKGASVSTAPRTVRSFFRKLDEILDTLERHLIMREKILASATWNHVEEDPSQAA
jgi:hypothetical protein